MILYDFINNNKMLLQFILNLCVVKYLFKQTEQTNYLKV